MQQSQRYVESSENTAEQKRSNGRCINLWQLRAITPTLGHPAPWPAGIRNRHIAAIRLLVY